MSIYLSIYITISKLRVGKIFFFFWSFEVLTKTAFIWSKIQLKIIIDSLVLFKELICIIIHFIIILIIIFIWLINYFTYPNRKQLSCLIFWKPW